MPHRRQTGTPSKIAAGSPAILNIKKLFFA